MNNFDDLFVSKKEKEEKQTYRHYDTFVSTTFFLIFCIRKDRRFLVGLIVCHVKVGAVI